MHIIIVAILEQNDCHTHDQYIWCDEHNYLSVVDFYEGKTSCFVGEKEKQGWRYTMMQWHNPYW